MAPTKKALAEQEGAKAELRAMLPPGSTLYSVLRHVSRSGMMRHIDFFAMQEGSPRWLSGYIGTALDMRRGDNGLKVSGCGMDMGFHVAHNLSYALWGEGYPCQGVGNCPSNYHVNHRDHIRCDGVYDEATDTRTHCYQPERWSRRDPEISPDWPRLSDITVESEEGPVTIPGPRAYCLANDAEPPTICPTCNGVGYLPNPEGPERFDLTHTDGYAIRHRWL